MRVRKRLNLQCSERNGRMFLLPDDSNKRNRRYETTSFLIILVIVCFMVVMNRLNLGLR
jgi:hypothetical protein